MLSGSGFFYADAVHPEHELALDDVFFRADALGVLDHGGAGVVVGVDKVGDVGALPLEELAGGVALGGDEHEPYLLAQPGDDPGALPQPELAGAGVLLPGGVGAGGAGAVFVAAPARERIWTVSHRGLPWRGRRGTRRPALFR